MLERALLALDALGERRDAAELGVHPGGEDDRAGVALGAGRAAEHEVAGLAAAARRASASSAERNTGIDSPVSVERSTSIAARQQPRVGGDAVALAR